MYTYKTNKGKAYAVTTTGSGQIETTDGVVIITFSAGQESYFVAPDKEVIVTDDEAKITPFIY